MTHRVLLYIDYDEQSGFGHISRSRTFIEAISSESTEMFMSSRLNPFLSENEMEFLKAISWIPYIQVEAMNFDLIYVDSYSAEILSEVEKFSINKKVLVIDANFEEEIPSWPDMVIDLERSLPRERNFNGSYLFADLLIHSDLELARVARVSSGDTKKKIPKLIGLVNLGGSLNVDQYLKQLATTFGADDDVSYYIYVPSLLFESLKIHFKNLFNVEVKAFSPSYHDDLANCDFLITNSGTSFMEGLYLRVPMVIFNLFPNAQSNFNKHRSSKKVIYSGSAADLESHWLSRVIDFFQMEFAFDKVNDEDLEIAFLDVNAIITELKLRVFN